MLTEIHQKSEGRKVSHFKQIRNSLFYQHALSGSRRFCCVPLHSQCTEGCSPNDLTVRNVNGLKMLCGQSNCDVRELQQADHHQKWVLSLHTNTEWDKPRNSTARCIYHELIIMMLPYDLTTNGNYAMW